MSQRDLADAFVDAARAVAPRLEASGLGPPETTRSGDDTATVAFPGEGVVLTLRCDRGEIDATLARSGRDDEAPFPIRLILGLAADAASWNRWPRIVGVETARRSVDALVDDVVSHGGPWLRGEREALRRLDDFRSVDLALKMAQFGPGRRPAGEWTPVREAWEDQALGDLVEAVRGLPGPLREAEERALEYAERYREG